MELLMRVPPPKVFDSLTASRLVDLIKIEEGMETKDIVDAFFSLPSSPSDYWQKMLIKKEKRFQKEIKADVLGIANQR